MNILLVQKDNNKFVNNIQYTNCGNTQIIVTETNNNLYEIYYRTKFNAIIVMASNFNTEIYQFINEYAKDLKIYIYHNKLNQELLSLSDKLDIKQIIPNIYKHKNIKYSKVYNEPILVNTLLYNNQINVTKTGDISCFLDNLEVLPEKLLSYLYPNTKLPIKLYNNSKIKHHQNLGLLTEKDKSNILMRSEYYLCIDDYYATEAALCGCKVLSLDELDDLKPNRYKKKKEYQTYSQYIENFIYGN